MSQMNSLILLRGLPGSGKSTLAQVLSEDEKYPVFSVDDYFTTENGDYQFEYTKNHLAYKSCEENTRNAMQYGIQKVFVDNTLTMDWELEPYFRMAAEFGYKIFVVTVENRHGSKNTHGISDEQIKKMAEKYRVVLH